MRVVLDTNILVSGLIKVLNNPSLILDAATQGRFSLYLSNSILTEFAGVMPRKFGWDSARTARAVLRLSTIAAIVDPPSVASGVSGHALDDRILDCVAAAEADFLVTGDRRHLLPLRTFGNARIVTAAEFLEELEASDS